MQIKLLVIHEEEGICDFIKSYFEDQGLAVFYALSGEEALKIFEKERPQIIILDDSMRKISSLDILKQLKQIDHDNYVFILTRHIESNLEMLTQALAIGAKDYFQTPVLPEDLGAAIMPLVERIKQRRKNQ